MIFARGHSYSNRQILNSPDFTTYFVHKLKKNTFYGI